MVFFFKESDWTIFQTIFRKPSDLTKLEEDAEVRYVVEGTLLYDVRNEKDEWVAFKVSEGHLLSIPPNVYHRFTVGSESTKTVRYFAEIGNLPRTDRTT